MCLYMIKKDMSFVPSYSPSSSTSRILTSELITPSAERAIFFTMGALMRDAAGLKKALQLLTAIAEHRRTDLAMDFNYSKVLTINPFSVNWEFMTINNPFPGGLFLLFPAHNIQISTSGSSIQISTAKGLHNIMQ